MTLYLISSQAQIWEPSQNVPIKQCYIQLFFMLHKGNNHNIWKFPNPICMSPIPSKLGMKFCYDLEQSGVDLRTLPTSPLDGQILPIFYPRKFPEDWWKIGKMIEEEKKVSREVGVRKFREFQ